MDFGSHFSRSNAINKNYLQEEIARTRTQVKRSDKSVRARYLNVPKKDDMIDFEQKRKDIISRRSISAGLGKQSRLNLLEKTQAVALQEIEAYYYKEYLPRVAAAGLEKQPRASSLDRKTGESYYHRETEKTYRRTKSEKVKKAPRAVLEVQHSLRKEKKIFSSPHEIEASYHRENVNRNLLRSNVEKVSADPEKRPRVRFVERDTKTVGLHEIDANYDRKISSRSAVERLSNIETAATLGEAEAYAHPEKVSKLILKGKSSKQPRANSLEKETEVVLQEIKAYNNCPGENAAVRSLPRSNKPDSANYKRSTGLENRPRINLLGTNENEAFDQKEDVPKIVPRVKCGTLEKVAFDESKSIMRTKSAIRIVKKVAIDEGKKVTKTIKTKKVAFDESRNIINWFEVEKTYWIDDYPEETNRYANMSNDQLNSKCEEFIHRLTMQMRLQGQAFAIVP
ncbi:hypothetical protein Tsubulata_014150 [Turnera subulata]|uniref:Uncharacterized protein n=1 Tax=Turnera subulata TaxID=218843 RepID=A0A9Q0F5L1_9ROSI|nr:hypothetical protein Tsubulata_014150 [Turnera subulata]